MSASFVFGDYAFDLRELCDEIEAERPDGRAIAAWARLAAKDPAFLDVLRAQAEPLLDEETRDDPLDVMGEGAAQILKTALAALYDLDVQVGSVEGAPGPRLRQSDLAERDLGL